MNINESDVKCGHFVLSAPSPPNRHAGSYFPVFTIIFQKAFGVKPHWKHPRCAPLKKTRYFVFLFHGNRYWKVVSPRTVPDVSATPIGKHDLRFNSVLDCLFRNLSGVRGRSCLANIRDEIKISKKKTNYQNAVSNMNRSANVRRPLRYFPKRAGF